MRTPCTLPLDPPLHGSLTLPWKASLHGCFKRRASGNLVHACQIDFLCLKPLIASEKRLNNSEPTDNLHAKSICAYLVEINILCAVTIFGFYDQRLSWKGQIERKRHEKASCKRSVFTRSDFWPRPGLVK